MFFVSYTGKFCLTWGHEGIFLFSFRTFGIWFRSMTHLELIFVYGMWSESKYIFFHKDTKLFLQYLLERQILQEQLAKIGTTPKNSFGTFVKKKSQLTEYVWVCFYTLFCSIFYLSMLRPIPLPWLLYIYNEFWNQVKSSNFFFQHVLPILFYFHFCMYLEPSCLLLQNSMLPFWYKLHWMYISN